MSSSIAAKMERQKAFFNRPIVKYGLRPLILLSYAYFIGKRVYTTYTFNQTSGRIAERMRNAEKDVPTVVSSPLFRTVSDDGGDAHNRREGEGAGFSAAAASSSSPASMRIVTLLRILRIPHKIVFTTNPAESPSGRLPCMELDMKSIPDTTTGHQIIDQVIAKFPEKVQESGLLLLASPEAERSKTPSQQSLTPEEDHEGFLFARMMENSTRLALDRHTIVNHPEFFIDDQSSSFASSSYPKALFSFMFHRTTRKDCIAMLNAHGQGDLTEDRFYEEFLKDIKAIERQLVKVNERVGREAGGKCPTAEEHTGGIATSRGLTRHDVSVFAMLDFAKAASCYRSEATDLVLNSAVIRQYMQRVEQAAQLDDLRKNVSSSQLVEGEVSFTF